MLRKSIKFIFALMALIFLLTPAWGSILDSTDVEDQAMPFFQNHEVAGSCVWVEFFQNQSVLAKSGGSGGGSGGGSNSGTGGGFGNNNGPHGKGSQGINPAQQNQHEHQYQQRKTTEIQNQHQYQEKEGSEIQNRHQYQQKEGSETQN
jgi:hypothetical protein